MNPFIKAITEEQIEDIRNANLSEKPNALAERLGIAVHLVYYWRAKFRKQAAGGKPTAPKKKSAGKKPAKEAAAEFEPEPETTEPADEPATLCANIAITEKALDAWWLANTTDFKLSIFECNLLLSIPDAQ